MAIQLKPELEEIVREDVQRGPTRASKSISNKR